MNTTTSNQSQVIYAAELLGANSNIGTGLLSPTAMQGVTTELNAFQAMGINGVSIDLSYPLFLPDYPNSQKYINFYENVSQDIHSRGMTLEIEYQVVLAGTQSSSLVTNYSNITWSQLLQQRQQMANIIISDIHPDILDLGTEETTYNPIFQINGGDYPQLETPQGWYNFTVGSINGVNLQNTKIAAGVGDWMNPSYLQYILNDSRVTYISLHIFPIQQIDTQYLITDAQLAKEHGKPLIIDETNLWKNTESTPDYSNITTEQNILNPYGFWAPLDEKFISDVVNYSRNYNVKFMSVFTIQSFFEYLNYNSSLANYPVSQETYMYDVGAGAHMREGVLSPTGCRYKVLASENQT